MNQLIYQLCEKHTVSFVDGQGCHLNEIDMEAFCYDVVQTICDYLECGHHPHIDRFHASRTIKNMFGIIKPLEQSWITNPDRMGGSFTQDEINEAGAWK